VAVDLDLQKVEYASHNAKIYQVVDQEELQLVHSDFLKLNQKMALPMFKFPAARKAKFDCVFMSPPWGGSGYQYLDTYTLDHIFPEFSKIVEKSL
jgi:trimethylguanosine synthase